MALYTERVQTMLTNKQYQLLTQVAQNEQKPLSVLVREAIEQVFFVETERRKRHDALNQIIALQAPVADWPQMEAEIIEGGLT